MKIEIDTKKDSVDDIKKTIEFLSKFISESSEILESNNIGAGAFNMFDNPDNDNSDDKDKEDETPTVSVVEY